jgi:LEA14-like dessication related protein
MKFLSTKYFIVFAAAALLFGCAAMQQLIQPPSVSVAAVKVQSATFQNITVGFDLAINNPNPFGVQLDGFDYSLAIQGQEFLKGTENKAINIMGANKSHVNIPLTIQFQELYKLITQTESLDSLAYQIKGHFLPGGLLAGLNVPFSKSGKLPNIHIPKLSFKGLKIAQLNLSGVNMELGLDIGNSNVFGFDVGKLDYQIQLAGTKVASGLSQNLAKIPAKGKGEIKIPITLDFAGLTSSLRSILSGQSVQCGINGSADLDSPFGVMQLPLNTVQDVKIFR